METVEKAKKAPEWSLCPQNRIRNWGTGENMYGKYLSRFAIALASFCNTCPFCNNFFPCLVIKKELPRFGITLASFCNKRIIEIAVLLQGFCLVWTKGEKLGSEVANVCNSMTFSADKDKFSC